jgi:two-component system, response regulator
MKNLPTRILIVEDNVDDEALLLRQLKKADLHRQVKIISDGGIALDYLSNEQSQCENLLAVFLDLQLPTVDGLRLLESIRSQERIRHLRVILMTSSDAHDQIERCHALKASFVPRPLTFTSFARALAGSFHDGANAPRMTMR